MLLDEPFSAFLLIRSGSGSGSDRRYKAEPTFAKSGNLVIGQQKPTTRLGLELWIDVVMWIGTWI
jgi:hypothetical protein